MRPTARRAVGLIRVSKVAGREELLSPDLQRTAISAYAEARGYLMTEWVEALDESGSQARSPWWRRLDNAVEQVEAGELDAVLVWKFSRAARHRKKWAVALDRVEAVGGVLESATEQVDTQTSTGRLARGMLAELAAWEADVKGEQWQEVFASRLSRGLPATGRARFGYTYERGVGFEPDPKTGPVLAQMYERFVAGATFPELANWLIAEGVTGTSGTWWTTTNLCRYMDRGFGAGIILHNGVEYPGAHEPVITAQVWAAYQRVRETTRRVSPRTRAATHPLAGLVVCGVCGGPSCRTSARQGRKAFFKCCLRHQMATACSGPTASERRVHAAVLAFLGGIAEDLDARREAVREQRAKAGQVRVSARRAAVEVERLDEALARLAVQAAQGLLPASAHALAQDDLLRARGEAEARRMAAEGDAAAFASPAPETARRILESWDELVEVDPKGVRDVLRTLIARVEVHHIPEGQRVTRIEVVPRWAV